MAKKKNKREALIFIDTNILLDFYRIRKSDISLKYLDKIDKHKDLIIISSQVEMEFKKNRQAVILESIGKLKTSEGHDSNLPVILTDTKPTEIIDGARREIVKQQKKLKEKIEKIFANPSFHDPVYKTLQKVFKHKSTYNLDRDNKRRFAIKKLALKRFMLGYPPRKKDDNSIGDAVNWEWIIECAINSGKDVIIVTRDTDFGTLYNNDSFLNDWLIQEFKERVSRERKITLTDKLTHAFKAVEIPFTKEMAEEEKELIKSNPAAMINENLQKVILRMIKNMKFEGDSPKNIEP